MNGHVPRRARPSSPGAVRRTVVAAMLLAVLMAACEPAAPPATLFGNTVPAIAAFDDPAAVELGVRFSADVAGSITAVRFYQGSGNGGPHPVSLWTAAGSLLATATPASTTPNGWNSVPLAPPVRIQPGITYIASYYAPSGHYAANKAYFATGGHDVAPLHAPASSATAANGVYHYGASAFPTDTFGATNYWVDVEFQPAPPSGTDSTPSTPATTSTTTSTTSTSTTTSTTSPTAPTLPFYGGAAYWARFSRGPHHDASQVPVTVWLQSPSNVGLATSAGINTFTGLWDGPTAAQVSALAAAGVTTWADQNAYALANLSSPTLRAWTQIDEPDNAQADGNGGWGPCIPASTVQATYARVHGNDPTRPVFLNFGQAIADPTWPGRGVCSDQPGDYANYARGADVLSFDIYPNVNTNASRGHWEYVAKGIDALQNAVSSAKPVMAFIGATPIDNGGFIPTRAQLRAEVWLSLTHGAAGVGWFCHRFEPSFVEAWCLTDPTMKANLTALDAEVQQLAPAINVAPLSGASATGAVSIRVARANGHTYVMTVNATGAATTSTLTIPTASAATATVINESRAINVAGGKITDQFTGYGVHLYQIG